MKEITISSHALKRAKERGIPESWASEVIRHAEETITVKFGRKASFRKREDFYVVVIYEESVDKILVVTILKTDRERLERYGFGRV